MYAMFEAGLGATAVHGKLRAALLRAIPTTLAYSPVATNYRPTPETPAFSALAVRCQLNSVADVAVLDPEATT